VAVRKVIGSILVPLHEKFFPHVRESGAVAQ